MANLLELAEVEQYSVSDPGSPADPTIEAARNLRLRLRMLLCIKAYNFMQAAIQNPPADPDAREHQANVAFAQLVLRNPESYVDAVLRIALAENTGATVAQILAATDQQLDNMLTVDVLSILAYGLRPGR